MRVLLACAVGGALILSACGPKATKKAEPSTTTTTVVPETTTTTTIVEVVPTTLPVATTRPRPTTTTTEPEPEVQVAGEAVMVESDAVTAGLLRIAACEQPGSGPYGVNWGHRGPTYQGGLGLYWATYQDNKPDGAPENAGDATIEQQLQTGRNIVARYGFRAWGCARKVGLA